MGLQITLPANSPALSGGGYQGTSLYARLGGIHYVKRANRCSLPLEYYATRADAQAEPEGPQVFPAGLPVAVEVNDPNSVLDSETLSTRAMCYVTARDMIVALGGPGTTVAPA